MCKVAAASPEEASERPDVQTAVSWTSSLQNYEKINFHCLSHSVHGTLLRQPQQTDTGGIRQKAAATAWDRRRAPVATMQRRL